MASTSGGELGNCGITKLSKLFKIWERRRKEKEMLMRQRHGSLHKQQGRSRTNTGGGGPGMGDRPSGGGSLGPRRCGSPVPFLSAWSLQLLSVVGS